jgi:diguanylate cyclase (GGDEF)-like protein/putative nucleotidyltransferase with HDIG domain
MEISVYSLLPLLSTIAYVFLIATALKRARNKEIKAFITYLIVSLLFSVGTFILFADFFPDRIGILGITPGLFGILMAISYYHFVCAFTHKTGRLAVWLGYAVVAFIMLPLASLGYIPESVQLTSAGLQIEFGVFVYPLTIFGFSYIALSVFRLLQRRRELTDPLERSRVTYLIIGIVIVTLVSIREGIPPLPRFPLSQISNCCNAVIITYIVMRYQLFDIKLVLRKGLVYTGITTVITGIFLGVLFVMQRYLHDWSQPTSIMAIIGLAVIMALSFNKLRDIFQKGVDIMFYGKNYDYRIMVSSFAQRMNNVLDLDQLAEAMLYPISKALQPAQVSLLLSESDTFSSRYDVRFVLEETPMPIRLRRESVIITWLEREKKPLRRDIINVDTNFKALWEVDIKAIAEVELLFPLISKDKLVGILALHKRRVGGFYGNEDIDLLSTLSNEAAVVIENAELYKQAKERANVDELTGLYNHRYFHHRVNEEIARSSRFGDTFSLMTIDLDHFKSYNDVYGHLYGDKVLQNVGGFIKKSIRSVDMAFRYGGDEFAIILPHTSIDNAYKVAERVRKKIESDIDIKGYPLTCSIGIASWPTDGLMREEIIQASDAALYHSKQSGRNRTSMASELRIPEVLGILDASNNTNDVVINTIYALAATVDAKDTYTYGHSKKVSKYATDIAEALGFSEKHIASIRTAGLLHDIGKIGVADQILSKNGPLNDEEWEPIRSHPSIGVSILKHVEGLKDCIAAVQYHHERYDGNGYPSGLKGDNIPIDARILAIADSFDAMTSARPYRNMPRTNAQALEEIQRCSGTQFDPKIVNIFVEIMTGSNVPKETKTKERDRALA